jgi:imidazolonepropionase-like amidohydrolase
LFLPESLPVLPLEKNNLVLQYMVAAGLTPYKALKSGAINVATIWAMKDAGVIKGGFEDLVLLGGNPLAGINKKDRRCNVKWKMAIEGIHQR